MWGSERVLKKEGISNFPNDKTVNSVIFNMNITMTLISEPTTVIDLNQKGFLSICIIIHHYSCI